MTASLTRSATVTSSIKKAWRSRSPSLGRNSSQGTWMRSISSGSPPYNAVSAAATALEPP